MRTKDRNLENTIVEITEPKRKHLLDRQEETLNRARKEAKGEKSDHWG